LRADGFFLAIIFIGIPCVLAWTARASWAHQRYMKALELRAEANARLIDRFGSDPNVLDLLKSDGHRDPFTLPAADPDRSVPYRRMLTSIQVGFLLFAAGTAFLWVKPGVVNPNDQQGILFFGVLGVALGIGSLLSAVAAFVVGRWWGYLTGVDRSLSGPSAASRP
jgi:hypothetical protein